MLTVVTADARRVPLADATVDLIVTSPGYFRLRDYDAGPDEIGAEPHWRDYLASLVDATAEMARVLKPAGSIFVNLGDTYSAYNHNRGSGGALSARADPGRGVQAQPGLPPGIPNKSLMLLPERYRIACVDQLGLTARAVLIWWKPNGLPESVTDRVRRSHEDWIHLVKQSRYYSAVDEIRESYAAGTAERYAAGYSQTDYQSGRVRKGIGVDYSGTFGTNPLGKLPGSVWSIPSEPLRLPPWIDTAHYAAFPTEWPRRLILGWSPPGICLECGQGRFPVVARHYKQLRPGDQPGRASLNGETVHGADRRAGTHVSAETTIFGYACACTPHTDHPGVVSGVTKAAPGSIGVDPRDAWVGVPVGQRERVGPWREYHLDGWTPPPTRPVVVLDPFGGTGCTAHVAHALGRHGISTDLSEAYSRIAADKQLARNRGGKVQGRRNVELQRSLFDGDDA